MSLKRILTLGAIGAAAVGVGRASGLLMPVLAGKSAKSTMVPLPKLALSSTGYSATWAVLPAVGAYLLSR